MTSGLLTDDAICILMERTFVQGLRDVARGNGGTRERIERAAIKLFARRGVSGTSMRDIAREADVSLGGMYTHYPSKEALAWELFSRNWAMLGLDVRARVRASRNSLRDQLRAMAAYIFDLHKREPDLVTFIYFSRHEHLRRVKSSLPNPYMMIRMAVADAMTREEIPHQDVEVATAMVSGILIQMIDSKALGRIKQDLTRISDMVADRCYRLLKG
jgi:AcrR family transcriptional regulator